VEIEQPDWLLQMEDILETLNEGVLISDDCHRILFVNSCLADLTGMPPEDLIGKNSSHFYSAEENKFMLMQIERGAIAGHNRFEFVLPKKNGERIPVIISSRTFEDPNGRMFAVVTFTDISEQKNAELQVLEANLKLRERQEEIEADLALAARVQQSLAPQALVWGGMRVETYFHAVRTIGGDFGIISPTEDDHLTLLVGDVSGHGIGSALVANRIYTEMMTQLQSNIPLGDILRHLNTFVMRSIGSSVFFFTAAAARLDRGGRRMVFAGAGHPPAMIVTPGQEPRLLESRSMVLGALPDAVGVESTLDVDLDRGDRVVLYTDGFTDVFDSRGEMLGVEGVQKIVRETALLPFSEMKQAILDSVAEWREGPPSDDLSLVLAEIL
jgi:sigma-B regulation protein RsbU (phosphoserine phosphatase)